MLFYVLMKCGGRKIASSFKKWSKSEVRGVIRLLQAKRSSLTKHYDETVSDYGKDFMKTRYVGRTKWSGLDHPRSSRCPKSVLKHTDRGGLAVLKSVLKHTDGGALTGLEEL